MRVLARIRERANACARPLRPLLNAVAPTGQSCPRATLRVPGRAGGLPFRARRAPARPCGLPACGAAGLIRAPREMGCVWCPQCPLPLVAGWLVVAPGVRYCPRCPWLKGVPDGGGAREDVGGDRDAPHGSCMREDVTGGVLGLRTHGVPAPILRPCWCGGHDAGEQLEGEHSPVHQLCALAVSRGETHAPREPPLGFPSHSTRGL